MGHPVVADDGAKLLAIVVEHLVGTDDDDELPTVVVGGGGGTGCALRVAEHLHASETTCVLLSNVWYFRRSDNKFNSLFTRQGSSTVCDGRTGDSLGLLEVGDGAD